MLSLAVATGVNAGIVKENFKAQKPKVQTETVKKDVNSFKVDRVVEPKQMLRTPVTEQPAGEVKYYKRAGNALFVDGQYITAGEQDGYVMLIFAENNTVWIKNILYGCEDAYGDSYVYGTLSNDGTTLTVPMGQSIYWSDYYSADIVLAWGTSAISGTSIVFTKDASVTDAVFAINGDVMTLQNTQATPSGSDYPEYEGTGIGTYWTDDDSFGALLDYNTVWTYTVPAILPTNLTADPADTYANVTWTGSEENNWNLRWRPWTDTSGNPIDVTLPNATYEEELEGWAILDVDQDGYGWGLAYTDDEQTDLCFKSDSYYSGAELTPDNWLIAPLHKLEGVCKFKIAHKSSYPEKMEVMIGMEDAIDGNLVSTDEFTTIASYTTTGNDFEEQTIDLSSYNGAMGYVVFRHYGTTNQWTLYLDDIFIGDPNAEIVEPAEWIYPEENPLSVTNYTITGLTPETTYEVQVMAFNSSDETDYTKSCIFTTLPEENNVYILGEVGEQNWAPNAGVQMTYEDGVYTATVTFDGRNDENGELVNYFAFTKKLGLNGDDWATCNANRFGSETDGDFWVTPELMGQELGLVFPYEMSYRIAKGEYKMTVDLENMTLVIEDLTPPAPQGLRGDVNDDTQVTIADVSALIDYLLTENAEGVNLSNADCNLDEGVTIADVSALIDYLLTEVWN